MKKQKYPIQTPNVKDLPHLEPELDFTTTDATNSWCLRYGKKTSESTSSGTKTIVYQAKPTNLGKAFKFKVRYDYEVKTSGLTSGQTEGLYCKSRIIHCDSVGKVWWVEEEVEEQIFETTLHEHS